MDNNFKKRKYIPIHLTEKNILMNVELYRSLFGYYHVTECVGDKDIMDKVAHTMECRGLYQHVGQKFLQKNSKQSSVPLDSANLYLPPKFPVMMHRSLSIVANVKYGLCIAANETIAAHTELLEYVGEFVREDALKSPFSSRICTSLKKDESIQLEGFVIKTEVYSNECRFLINEPENANCYVEAWKCDNSLRMIVRSTCIIEDGNVLKVNFNKYNGKSYSLENHVAKSIMNPSIWESLFKWHYVEFLIDRTGAFRQIAREYINKESTIRPLECKCVVEEIEHNGINVLVKCQDDRCIFRKSHRECWDWCSPYCANRPLSGSQFCYTKLKVVPTLIKGFGVVAKQVIEKGEYVGEYLGEVIYTPSDEEDKQRLRYFIELKGMSIGINAEKYGNVTRLINHSCNPNLVLHQYLSNSNEVCLIFEAIRRIDVNEELGYNYMNLHKKDVCFCDYCMLNTNEVASQGDGAYDTGTVQLTCDSYATEEEALYHTQPLVSSNSRLVKTRSQKGSFKEPLQYMNTKHCCKVQGCGKIFPDAWKLDRHKESHERGLNKFTCKDCTKTFPDRSTYQTHYMTHRLGKVDESSNDIRETVSKPMHNKSAANYLCNNLNVDPAERKHQSPVENKDFGNAREHSKRNEK